MNIEPLVFVGIDWGGAAEGSACKARGMAAERSTEHQVCLTSKGDPIQRAFAHDAAGIDDVVDWLCAKM